MDTKKCSLCGKTKILAEFNKRSVNADGLDNRCRECVNEYQRRLHAMHNPPPVKEALPHGTKRCSKCKEVKAVSRFHRAKNTSDTLYPSCKDCQNKKSAQVNKARRDRDPEQERLKQRSAQLRHYYGIDLKEYEHLLVRQGGRCAICGVEECVSGKSFSVDHDHSTGIVRGILCMDCNVSLGKMKDDPGLLRAAADYLERFLAAHSHP